MNETKIQEKKFNESGVIGPSKDEWLMLGASISGVIEIQGIKNNGEVFMRNHKLDLPSIDILEYTKNKRHTHEVGGVSMKTRSFARDFYQNPNVKDVFELKKGNDIQIFLVLNEEVEDIALQLASLQSAIQKAHKEFFIEISYATEEETYLEELQNDYTKVTRR